MKKTFIILFIITSLVLGIVQADPDYYFKRDNNINLKIPCYNNDNYCSSSSTCFATIIDPLGNTIVNNETMQLVNGFTFYNLTSNLTRYIGEYQTSIVCLDSGEVGKSQFSFLLTDENRNYQNTLTLVIGLLGFIFFMFYLGVNLNDQHFFFKVFLLGFGFALLQLIPKSILWTDNSLIQFYKWASWITYIFLTYLVGYVFYFVFYRHYVKNEK